MVNEVVHETKDAAKADCCNKDNGMSFLSIVESAGRSAANTLQKVENFGSGVVSGGAAALGINLDKGTSDSIARGAVMLGLGGAGAVVAEQAIKHPGTTAAIAGGVAGAVAFKAVEAAAGTDIGKAAMAGAVGAANCAAECASKEVQKVGKDAAIGAAIGAAAGLATGDATRAVTLAAMGAVTGAAARCAAEMCKPCCCVKPVGAIEAMKDVGKAVLEHMKTRPFEAGAEAVIAGPGGLVAGAMIRDMLNPKCPEKLCEKAMKNTCCEMKKQADMIKKVVEPIIAPPVIEIVPGAAGAAKAAAEIGKVAAKAAVDIATGGVATEATKATVKAAQQAATELEQHRKDNPTSSKIEKGIGYAAGGPIAGGVVGSAIEYGDVKARQAYKFVKGLFE